MKQMMNPTKQDLMEYDCVHQLKNLVKRYYIRKGQLTEGLLKRLDAGVVERPRVMERKKEYFIEMR
jgi:hypothetical protein